MLGLRTSTDSSSWEQPQQSQKVERPPFPDSLNASYFPGAPLIHSSISERAVPTCTSTGVTEITDVTAWAVLPNGRRLEASTSSGYWSVLI